jgi:hypothetical protein
MTQSYKHFFLQIITKAKQDVLERMPTAVQMLESIA